MVKHAHITTNLVDVIFHAVRLVNVNVARRACSEFAGALVNCDSFELSFLVDVDGLHDMIWAVEYYEGVARDVCLGHYPSVTIMFFVEVRACRTMIWVPVHSPWATACSLACGLPGSMPRIEVVCRLTTDAAWLQPSLSSRRCSPMSGDGTRRGVLVHYYPCATAGSELTRPTRVVTTSFLMHEPGFSPTSIRGSVICAYRASLGNFHRSCLITSVPLLMALCH